MSMLISCEMTFDSAHALPYYDGKCSNLHGHTYRIQVTVKDKSGVIKKIGRFNEYQNPVEIPYLKQYETCNPKTGMVMDFSDLKAEIKQVIDELDHHNLNTFIINPTAENLVLCIADKLSILLDANYDSIELVEIKLWETPNNWVTWKNDGVM